MIKPTKPIKNSKLPYVNLRILPSGKLDMDAQGPAEILYEMLLNAGASISKQNREREAAQHAQQVIVKGSAEALKQLDELKRLREERKKG